MKLTAQLELGTHAMSKDREALYLVCSFHDADSQGLVDKHEPTLGKSLLDFVDVVQGDQPYDMQLDPEYARSQYDSLTFECIVDAAAIFERSMRSVAHGHLLCPATLFAQSYRMLSTSRGKKRPTALTVRAARPRKIR